MIKRLLVLLIAGFLLLNGEAFAASGCNYPTSLDSYSNKTTGDFLTVADINSRSCAIEQLELAQRQLLVIGKPGGNSIIGGSGANETLTIRSTAHATKGQILIDAPQMTIATGTASGPRIQLDHSTIAGNDAGAFQWLVRDASSAPRITASILGWYLDSTTTSQDSEIQFCIQNNANTVSCNTIARLSSLGVWTDASSASIKDYEGDIPGGAINKLKELKTIGVYRARGLSSDKIPNAERHYSPTAEDFYKVTGLGTDTGIAPKDAAFIAAKAVLELEARVQALEKVAP